MAPPPPLKKRGGGESFTKATPLSPGAKKTLAGASSPLAQKAQLDQVLLSARKKFLISTDQNKSPQKRPHRESTPSPAKSSSNHIGGKGTILSPASLKKAGVGSPPKKKPKLWKSKWQLATLSGGTSETGKKKRATEASRLLDDEGVIHMLNRVPSVYGILPPGPAHSNLARVQRARNATHKPSAKRLHRQPKHKLVAGGEAAGKRSHTLVDVVKVEENQPCFQIKDLKEEPECVSPRRAVRNLTNSYSSPPASQLIREPLSTSSRGSSSEDGFGLLKDLPAEQLELLANCDIRYSLPAQGLPVPAAPAAATTAVIHHQLGLVMENSKGAKLPTSPHKLQQQLVKPVSKQFEVRKPLASSPLSSPSAASTTAAACSSSCHHAAASAAGSGGKSLPPLLLSTAGSGEPDRLARLRSLMRGEEQQQQAVRTSSGPGSYSHIFLRFYEDFVQITLSAAGARLTGSLSPPVIEELIQAVDFVAGEKRYRGILLTGVGPVFCQGVDLFYLVNDRPEKRKEAAEELAAGVERLVLSLARFPKLLVAVVNGLATGLGLALLPLCDLVYASDKATFNSLAARLGHIPEGGVSTTFAQGTSGTIPPLLAEIFLFGRTVTGSELAALGHINGLFLAGRLMEETFPRIRRGMAQSTPNSQWTKVLFKQTLTQSLERVLPGETNLLADMWSSPDFHRNLVHFLNTDKCLLFRQQTHK